MRRLRLVVVTALAASALGAAGGAAGQTTDSVPRVGVIHRSGHHRAVAEGLRQGLRELGLEEGKHLVLDVREVGEDPTDAARALEAAKVALIYTVTVDVSVKTMRATTHTPIVFYAGADPITAGLVQSLAKPGGRATGIHGRSRDLTAKRLELLKELVPGLRRVVTFYNPRDIVAPENARRGRETARQLGLQIIERHAGSVDELRQALQALKPREAQAYFHTPSGMATSQAPTIIAAMRALKLPTMFHEEDLVLQGALASYGHSYREIGRLSAKHVQRVLAGTQPKDLPVENYDKVGLALNLRTAREIGLAIPPAIRIRADRVVE